MTEIPKDQLLEFIAKAHQHTYAAPPEVRKQHKCATPILPGHKDYHFVDGDWAYHDSYAGSQWAPGREVVFYQDQPVWCMSYQGQHNDIYSEKFFQEQVFPFLKRALQKFDPEMPFRGPSNYQERDFRYSFDLSDGDHEYFIARESITFKNEEVFFQDVMGELIK